MWDQLVSNVKEIYCSFNRNMSCFRFWSVKATSVWTNCFDLDLISSLKNVEFSEVGPSGQYYTLITLIWWLMRCSFTFNYRTAWNTWVGFPLISIEFCSNILCLGYFSQNQFRHNRWLRLPIALQIHFYKSSDCQVMSNIWPC